MATLREYYEKDFSHSVRIHVELSIHNELIEGVVLYDFAGYSAFLSLFVTGRGRKIDFFISLLSQLKYGRSSPITFDGRVTLPTAKEFPGQIRIENKPDFEILAKYFGDTGWISTKNIQLSRRVFIYSETKLEPNEIDLLKKKAKELGHELQMREEEFREKRSIYEKPLAFISYDSRDKEIAKKIAIILQNMMCPVWYDEFALKIGDNLRESIEKGIKECNKCILILSPNFLSNKGWTKTEFDSIFTRQILEEQKIVLPVWYKVTKDEIYNYSPSLLNIKGADWDILGEEEICRQIYKVTMV